MLPILINLPKWLFFLILSSGCGVSSNFGICLLRGRLALKPTPKSIFVFQLDLELMLSLSCSPPRVWHQSCKKGRFSSSFVAPGGLILIAPLSLSSSATFGLDSLSLSLSLWCQARLRCHQGCQQRTGPHRARRPFLCPSSSALSPSSNLGLALSTLHRRLCSFDAIVTVEAVFGLKWRTTFRSSFEL